MKKLTKLSFLIVGAFPANKKNKIFGGQVTACNTLIKSNFFKNNYIYTIDSTQISNPLPNIFIRSIFSFQRLIKFFIYLVFKKPNATIIFLADGSSAIEKGILVLVSRFFFVPAIIFPRAGGLITNYCSSYWFAFFVRNTLGRSSMFLSQGKSFQEFAITHLGFTPSIAPIIPNWTASKVYVEIGKRRNYQSNISIVRILFLGWVEDFKGIFELLIAAKILRDKNINFHLTIAGDGFAITRAKEFVDTHKLVNSITFTGWVNQKKKISLLKSNQIFVLPSWNEGFPNALVEAMCAGMACIVTDVGMIPDYVVNNRDALLIKPNNVDLLENALVKLIMHRYFRSEIAKNGALLARSTFTLDNASNLLSKAINSLIPK
jgi:glycosyltransferase involved in cell wall biosynthesis